MDYDSVTLTLEDGTVLECTIFAVFHAGERAYVALQPEDDDEAEFLLYRYSEDEDGNPSLAMIEDDEEYEIAADGFDELLDSLEFEDLGGDDE